jgi:hypothetical protein
MDPDALARLTKTLDQVVLLNREVAHLITLHTWVLLATMILVVAGLAMLWGVARQVAVSNALARAILKRLDH